MEDKLFSKFNSSNDRVDRASAFGVDVGLIPSQVKPIKLVFIASLLDAQHERDSVGNKSASLRVVPCALGNVH